MDNNSTSSPLNSGLTGRDYYSNLYSDSLEHEAEWLRRRSSQTADSICKLIGRQGLKPSNVLEVGCGTGAVLAELQRRDIAEAYYAIDYSPEAIEYVNKILPNVHTVVGDVTDCTELFQEHAFDLVICTHVLEHLETPERFLESLSHLRWANFIAEVPLENLFFGKIKGTFQDRGKHPAGHVQFFNRKSFLDLLSDAGLDLVDEYAYAPILSRDALEFRYGDSSRLRYLQKKCTEHYFPQCFGLLWTKYYHAHMAVLCRGTGTQDSYDGRLTETQSESDGIATGP